MTSNLSFLRRSEVSRLEYNEMAGLIDSIIKLKMVMRSILRGPISVFELYKSQTHANPKQMNMFLLLGTMFGILVLG